MVRNRFALNWLITWRYEAPVQSPIGGKIIFRNNVNMIAKNNQRKFNAPVSETTLNLIETMNRETGFKKHLKLSRRFRLA